MLFSWIVEFLKLRSSAIEMTAAGIEVAKVRPALRPKNTLAAVNATVMTTPRTSARRVSSVRGSAGERVLAVHGADPVGRTRAVLQTRDPRREAGRSSPGWRAGPAGLHSGDLARERPCPRFRLPCRPARRRDLRDELFGHPKGVYVCFFTEMWERFSFYGMKALLLLYLLQHHRFGDKSGYDVLGAYGGLVYCLPVIGGAARRPLARHAQGGDLRRPAAVPAAISAWRSKAMRRRVANGVVTRDEGALQIFYLSLALIIMGVGFLKPNISTIVGKLYPENDPRRDSGFSLFYAGINLGALFASIVCGYLGQTLGWSYGFGAAGHRHAVRARRSSCGDRNTCTATPNRHAPDKLRERVLGPAARMGDLSRRARRPAAGGVADVGGRQRRVLARRRGVAGAGADDPGDGWSCWVVLLVHRDPVHAGATPPDDRADHADRRCAWCSSPCTSRPTARG